MRQQKSVTKITAIQAKGSDGNRQRSEIISKPVLGYKKPGV
jgi:hypothetical protein